MVKENQLYAKLSDHEFVVSTQLDPPRVLALNELYGDIAVLKKAGVEVVDINTSRRLSHDSITLATHLKTMFGLEIIPHVSPRDSSIEGLMKQILSSYALSHIQNFLVISGDPFTAQGESGGNAVCDSIRALNAIDSHLRSSNLAINLTLAAAVDQNRPNSLCEGERVQAKIRAGADFFMSQPVFTPKQADMTFRFYRQYSQKPLMMGIWPLTNARTLNNIRSGNVTGVTIPDEVYDEASSFTDEHALRSWGVAKAHELTECIKTSGFAHGVYIVAPLRKPSQLEDLIGRINQL